MYSYTIHNGWFDMEIFSWLLLSYSLNFGMIVPEYSQPVVMEDVQIQPFFIEYGFKLTAFDHVYVTSKYENVFEKRREDVYFNPILDKFFIEVGVEINSHFSIYANHYCRHYVENGTYDIYNGLNYLEGIEQAQTRVGILLNIQHK